MARFYFDYHYAIYTNVIVSIYNNYQDGCKLKRYWAFGSTLYLCTHAEPEVKLRRQAIRFNIRVLSITSTSVHLQWDDLPGPSSKASKPKYNLEISRNTSQDSAVSHGKYFLSTDHYQLNDLEPCTWYVARVTAKTSTGRGTVSDSVQFQTRQGVSTHCTNAHVWNLLLLHLNNY